MLSLELLAVALSCGFLYFCIAVWKAMSYWKDKEVKHFKPWPVVGNVARAILLRKHVSYYYDELYQAFPEEKMVGMYEFMTSTLILRDLELIEKVLVTDFSTFADHGDFLFEPTSIQYESVFSITGTRWRAIRNKLLTTFTTGKMRTIFPEMVRSCQKLVESDLKILNKDVFHRFAVKSFMSLMFGTEILPAGEEEITNNCKKIFEPKVTRIYQQLLLTYFPKIADYLSFKFMPKYLDDYFRSLLNTVLDQRDSVHGCKNDYAQVLCDMRKMGTMNIYNRENRKIDSTFEITNSIAIAQAFMFFFAGLDTTTLLMLHLALELSLAKDCQEKARQEVRSVLKKHGGYSWEAVRDMKYLDQCIQEALRKHPSIQFVVRVSNKDTELNGIQIKKGTRIVVPLHSIQLDPKHYPNPEVFDPERFKHSPKKFTHLPFSDGPRVCLGKRFATMEVATLFAHILDNFELSLSPKTKLPLVYQPKSLFHQPAKEVCVVAERIPSKQR